MNSTKRERNLNYIAWPTLSQEYESPFTPCRPVDASWAASDFEWPTDNPCGEPSEANEDIVAGRVYSFESLDEMLDSLKKARG